MPELKALKKEIAEMAHTVLKIWKMTHRAFMEHNLELFPEIFSDENKVNDWEKDLTAGLVEISHGASKEEKAAIPAYADIIGDLELIGDYCKDILERVQIKIEEKLLFSDDAVSEYNELYLKATELLENISLALDKDHLLLSKKALKEKDKIYDLVDEYRARHNQRLIQGICSPFACNMFLNMLDFTAAVYSHALKIAKSLEKIEKA
ncbi:MAG: hypothetical protein JW788_04840 [Candidatus Omnitrophica bacterium]|nr:hypothetical protein [Candidatus Omnitrophota bacterium]